MQERLRGYATDILDRWNNLERNQKIKLIATVLIFIITLAVTIYITTRPKMVKLYSNMELSEIAEIQNALNDAGIYNRVTDNSTAIEVREKDASAAQLDLTTRNIPSGSNLTFADALSYTGMGTTETIKKETMRRLKESDMSRNLKMIEGIESAMVSLAMPNEDNYFQETTQKPSASAVLVLSKTLDKNQGYAIALYISRSVKNLSMEDIEIRDQNANIVYSGVQEQTGSLTSQLDIENQYKNEYIAMIRSSLVTMFDDVKVNPHLKINWDKVVQTEKQYSSPTSDDTGLGLVNSQKLESESVTGGTSGNAPGLDANDQTTPQYNTQNNTSSNATIKNSDTDYLHNEINKQTEISVGGVQANDSSISVIVYKYMTMDEDYMTRNDKLNGATWEDFKAANWGSKSFAIDQGVLDTITMGTGISNLSVVGYEVPVFVDKVVTPIKIEQIVMFVILALLILLLAYGLIRSTQPVEVTEIEPELSVEDLLVSTQLEEQKEADVERLRDIDFSKESESKRLIEKFVQDKPEAVAQLLRNWLNEGWES